jgi:hypothetical protein
MTATSTTAFNELLGLRTHYENLRVSGGSFEHRSDALNALQAKRAELAALRATA